MGGREEDVRAGSTNFVECTFSYHDTMADLEGMGQSTMGAGKFLCCWKPLTTPGGIGETTGGYFHDMPQTLGLTSAWKLFNTGATISLISCKRDQRRIHCGVKQPLPAAHCCPPNQQVCPVGIALQEIS